MLDRASLHPLAGAIEGGLVGSCKLEHVRDFPPINMIYEVIVVFAASGCDAA